MKTLRYLWYLVQFIVVALLMVACYRLWQRMVAPDNLLLIGHYSFVFLLGLFCLGTVLYSRRAASLGSSGSHRVALLEFGTMLCIALLFAVGFFLVDQSRLLAGKELVARLPLLPESIGLHPLLSGPIASLAVVVPFFLLQPFLAKMIPQRHPLLLPLCLLLCAMGLLLLYRLGPDIATRLGRNGFIMLFRNQLISLYISLVALVWAVLFFTPERLERLTRKRYIYGFAGIVLIILTALFGTEMHGRRLSLNLGVINFQTVELVKLLALFFMVGYFRYEGRFLEAYQGRLGLPRVRYLMPYLFMWGFVLLPIFLQKDLGPTALLFALFLTVFYLGTGSVSSVCSGLGLLIGVGAFCYTIGFPSMVRTRLDMWLSPFRYSQNMAESLWAVAGGGLGGAGLGAGSAYRIPVVWSDFNYAAWVEESGLIGGLSLLAAIGALAVVAMRSGARCRESHLQLLGAGIGALWILQSVVIVGGNLGLLPLTGITLPFISFGGSSMIINFIALGIVLRISAFSAMATAEPEVTEIR